jgi:H+/Cl- antiporter ClcA
MLHGITDILGQIEVIVTLLLQRDHDWEPEVLLLIVFLGGLVAVVTWLVVRTFPKVRRDERPEASRDSAVISPQGALRPRRDHPGSA